MSRSREDYEFAQRVVKGRYGPEDLSNYQFHQLGFNAYNFGYYGTPTEDEMKAKAAEIIEEYLEEERRASVPQILIVLWNDVPMTSFKNWEAADLTPERIRSDFVEENGFHIDEVSVKLVDLIDLGKAEQGVGDDSADA